MLKRYSWVSWWARHNSQASRLWKRRRASAKTVTTGEAKNVRGNPAIPTHLAAWRKRRNLCLNSPKRQTGRKRSGIDLGSDSLLGERKRQSAPIPQLPRDKPRFYQTTLYLFLSILYNKVWPCICASKQPVLSNKQVFLSIINTCLVFVVVWGLIRLDMCFVFLKWKNIWSERVHGKLWLALCYNEEYTLARPLY